MRNLFSVAILSLPASAAAQQPVVVKLQPYDARLETGFTAITSIRELSDGRILVQSRNTFGAAEPQSYFFEP